MRVDPALPRLIVMISGSGTNLQAIIDAIGNGQLQANIVLVVSNRETAYGLERAKSAGIPTLYFPLKPFREAGHSRRQYDVTLAEELKNYRPTLIVLAGWMHILSDVFLDQFPQKVINLHPALPGQFAGTHAIERGFAAYQQGKIGHSGCMVHYVIPEVDAGTVIAQEVVPIYQDESLSDFEERMHATEHRLIVRAINLALPRPNV